MLTMLLPLLVAVVGILAYALSNNAKIAELGRLLFFAGILVTLLVLAEKVVKV